MKRSRRTRSMHIEPLENRTLLAAIKIMPLGDSITSSFGGHASYRWLLWNELQAAGYTNIDFVGSQSLNNGQTPLYSNFDPDNEGHAGWTADQIASNIGAWATSTKPDIVLLHIGSNDIEQNQSNSSTITDITNIINILRQPLVVPNVKILLAEIIPETSNTAQFPALNSMIATLAGQMNTANSPIVLVDQYTGFNANTDTFDGVHPDDSGEHKMAAKWLAALETPGILPAPTPPVQNWVYLSDMNPTSATSGWGPIEKDLSNGETAAGDGRVIGLNSIGYLKGVGMHANADVSYNISGGGYTSFQSGVGVDDEVNSAGSVVFQVYVDGVLKYTSPTMTGTSTTQSINIPLSNASTLRLVVTDAGNGNTSDHADWANARLIQGTPLNKPTGLGAVITNGQPVLTWTDNATNETGYRVERKTGANGTYAQIAEIPVANTQTYTDNTTAAATTYYYRVYAYGPTGISPYADETSITTPLPPPPSDPTGLQTTSVTYQQVALSWIDTATNETGYRVERKTGVNGVYSLLKDITSPNAQSYTDLTVAANTEYFYHVYAYNAGGPSNFSNELDVTTSAAPQIVYVSDLTPTSASNGYGPYEKDMSNGESAAGDGHIITLNGVTYAKGLGTNATATLIYNLNGQYTQFLSDVGIDDEEGSKGTVNFQVYLDNGATAVYDSGTMTGVTATKSITIDVTGKTTLKLVVTNGGDNIDYDHGDWAGARLVPGQPTPPPTAPTSLTATLNGAKVDLAWVDSADDQTGFRIERKLGVGGTYASIGTVSGTTFTFSDTSVLAPSSTYYYRVFATNLGGDSAQPSNEQFIITPAPPPIPAAPTSLTATLNGAKVDLAWVDSAGDQTGFRIERKLGVGGTYASIGTVSGTTFTFSDTSVLAPSSTYYYRVFATNLGGDSAQPSNEQFIITPAPPPIVYVSDLTPTSASNGYGPYEKDMSNGESAAGDGHIITLNGVTYAKGLGTNATATLIYNLNGQYTQFLSDVGIDDEEGSKGTVNFQVYLDNGATAVYDSGTMTGVTATKSITIDVTGKTTLKLVVTNGGDNDHYDHGDWAGARLVPGQPTPPPAAPTNLNATYNATTGKVDLSWIDNTGDQTGFRIERKLGAGGTYAPVTTVSGTTLSYSDPGPFASNSTYFYRVFATNFGGDSLVPSNEQSILTPVSTTTYLSDLTPTSASNGYGPYEKDTSNGEAAAGDGHTITLNGVTYAKGLGMHAPSDISFNLGGGYKTFITDMGVDDEKGSSGTVVFQIYLDGTKVYDSGTMNNSSTTKSISLDVTGKTTLRLVVTDAGDGNNSDHADWAGARLLS